MSELPKKLSDFTREEVEDLYTSLCVDYLDVEEENEQLLIALSLAVEGMQKNRILAEGNQRVIDELLIIIQNHIDTRFTLNDVPKFLN